MWRHYLLLLVCAAVLGGQVQTTRAQTTQPDPTPAETTVPVEEASKRKEVAEKLRVAKRVLQSAQDVSAESNEKPPEQLTREVELLKQIETVLAQTESARASKGELSTRRADLEGQIEAVRANGPSEKRPYSFLLLDSLRDELDSKQSRAQSITDAVANASDGVTAIRTQCEENEKDLRRVKEQLESAKDETQRTNLATALKIAELELRLCKETASLRKLQLANEQATQEMHQIDVNLLEEKLRWIEQDARFTDSDLQDELVELEKQEADLQRSLVSSQANLEYAEKQWFDSRQRFDTATESNAVLTEEVEAKRLARQMRQQQVTIINARLQRLSQDRETWKRRFSVINETATTEELIEWQQEVTSSRNQLDRERRIQQQRIDELRSDISNRDSKLQAAGEQSEEFQRWVRDQQSAIQRLIQTYDRNIVSIDSSSRLQSKLLAEIEGDVQKWSAAEWFESGAHYVATIWNTELAKIDDRSITVGKVIVGVVLIFAGFIFSRLISRGFAHRLLRRFGMDEGGASALQSVTFYALLVFFTLSSLKFVNVPLTIFTLMGGAIAIGVGFGSQNIINNFISGLILLAERPIKVGDLIRLDDLFGNVVKIGARSTQIRTGDNLDIIVPNSKFLENNVINLTLGDDKFRTRVNVGVVYGSPTRDVSRLLQHAVEEHGQVLKNPRPFVWFVNFADNSLNFQVHFWVKARTMSERMRIESDLRYRIDQLFREANIVIAFPQRDVHLDAVRPIDVRLIPEAHDENASNESNKRDAA